MRWASVVLIVLAAGCTTAVPGDDGPTSGLVILEQGHASGFQVGAEPTRVPPSARERDAPPFPPTRGEGEGDHGQPPPPEHATAPEPSASAGPAFVPTGAPEPARPVRFALGSDATPGPYVGSVTLEDEDTRFTASLRAVAEATTRVGQLVVLQNVGTTTRTVELSAEGVADPRIQAASLLAGNATADLLVPSPALIVQLAPGAAVDLGIALTIGSAAPGEVLPTWTVSLDVSTP